jgi:hypothetical protein
VDSYSIRQLMITMMEYELRNYVEPKLPKMHPQMQAYEDLRNYQRILQKRVAELKLAHGQT